MRISAIIPAYNEKDNIEELTRRLYPILERCTEGFEIWYIYQGLDGGKEVIERLQDEMPNIKLKHFPEPLGAGGAFKEGFQLLSRNMDFVLTLDADLNHEPETLPLFISAAEKGSVVVGSRYMEGGSFDEMPLWKLKISCMANRLLSLLFKMDVHDMTSGYRLYDAEAIREIRDELQFKHFEFYPEALIRCYWHGYKIVEVPITYKKRMYGRSKLPFVKTGLGYLRLFFRLSSNTPLVQGRQ